MRSEPASHEDGPPAVVRYLTGVRSADAAGLGDCLVGDGESA